MRKGFTLVELLVIIAIIGLVSASVIFSIHNKKLKESCNKGDNEACKQLKEAGIEIDMSKQIKEKCNKEKVDCRNYCALEDNNSQELNDCLLRCDIKTEKCLLAK